MDVRYCDVCGSIVSGGSTPPPPEGEHDIGAVCESCLRTRLVLPDTAPADAPERRHARLQCPHCDAKMRAKLPRERREITCPRCRGGMALLPDGTVEVGAPPLPAKAPSSRSSSRSDAPAAMTDVASDDTMKIAASAFDALAASDRP